MQPADSTPIAAASTPGVPRNYGFVYIGSDQRIYAVLQSTESITDVNSGGVGLEDRGCAGPVAVADTNRGPTAISPLGHQPAQRRAHLHELEPEHGLL